jgi:hypothetical protein
MSEEHELEYEILPWLMKEPDVMEQLIQWIGPDYFPDDGTELDWDEVKDDVLWRLRRSTATDAWLTNVLEREDWGYARKRYLWPDQEQACVLIAQTMMRLRNA